MVEEIDRLFEMKGNVELGVEVNDGMGIVVPIGGMKLLEGNVVHDDALFPKLVGTNEGCFQRRDVKNLIEDENKSLMGE